MSDGFGWSGGISFYQSAFSFLRVNSHRKPFGEGSVIGVESCREKEDICMYEYWHLVVFVESRSFVSRGTKIPKIEDPFF
jgi:hypothetical protein